MAEGFEDWGDDMDDFKERFPEYDDQSTDNLDDNLNDLRERLLYDNDPLITERITYINNILEERGGEQETDFGGRDRSVADSVRSDVFTQIDKYVQDSRGNKLSPYSDSVIELRRRTTIKDGKVIHCYFQGVILTPKRE